MIPIFAYCTLEHVIFIAFRIRIWSRASAINSIKILIIFIFRIDSRLQLKGTISVN